MKALRICCPAILLFACSTLADAALYVVDPLGGGTHTTIAAAVTSATTAGDIVEITAGTYTEPAMEVAGVANLTIRTAAGADVTINGQPGQKVFNFNDCPGLVVKGTAGNLLKINGNNGPTTFESNPGTTLDLEYLHIAGNGGAASVFNVNSGGEMRDSILDPTTNIANIGGSADFSFTRCQIIDRAFSTNIRNFIGTPGRLIFNDCTLSAATGAVLPLLMTNSAGGSTILNNCDIQGSGIANRFINPGDIGGGGAGHRVVFNNPTISGFLVSVAQIQSGLIVEVNGASAAAKTDLSGVGGVHGLFRFDGTAPSSGNELLLTDVIFNRSISTNGGTFEADAVLTLNRCEYTSSSSAMINHSAGSGGIGTLTVNATNSIIAAGANNVINTGNDTVDTFNLTHCTVYPADGAAGLNMVSLGPEDVFNANYSLFDGGGQATIANTALNGTYNFIESAGTSDFTSIPGDTTIGTAALESNGRMGAGSIDVGGRALGSTEALDIDGNARPNPVGSHPDCGASETDLLPVAISDFELE